MVLQGCAEPRVPSGGPRDTTPPALVASNPPNEAVTFRGDAIRLEFTEYVNQASFARALSITPDPEGRMRFRWRKRRVSIRFQERFRDSTTYVIVLDNNLRDMQGVALKRPITLAFSTGDVIDQGKVHGRVVQPSLGDAAAGLDVLAYAIRGDTIERAPSYQTQTGDDGTFALAYLREEPYFVIALQDRNRDRQPGPTEPFAPPPVRRLVATPDSMPVMHHWVVSPLDTIAPRAVRVRSLSRSRLRVRFSESVTMPQADPAAWTLQDSLSGERIAVRTVYIPAGDTRSVHLRTHPLRARVYGLRPDAALTDSIGNPVAADTLYFVATARSDTTAVRFTGFLPADSAHAATLAPYVTPRITFSEALWGMPLSDLVSATNLDGSPRAIQGVTRDGTTYAMQLEPPLTAEAPATISVRDPGGRDSVYAQHFSRLGSQDLGSLSGNVLPIDSLVRVELLSPTRAVLMATRIDTSGTFAFDHLPLGQYHLRAYLDFNNNGRWDGGQLRPYAAPEPIGWLHGPEQVRPRWDTVLSDTLHIPTL